jgi:hypothetical protein
MQEKSFHTNSASLCLFRDFSARYAQADAAPRAPVGNIHAISTYPAIARLLFFKYFIAGREQFLQYLEGWRIIFRRKAEILKWDGMVP